MGTAHDHNRDDALLGKKLKDLHDLIEGIEIAKDRTRERVSVSGRATISQDRRATRDLKVTKPAPVVLSEVAKGMLAGTPPNGGTSGS